MDQLDPRHGTIAGYTTHYRQGETPCQPCKAAKASYRRVLADREDDEIELTDGEWRIDLRRRVLVWTPTATTSAA